MVEHINIFVIYFSPIDYPGKYVVRRHMSFRRGVLIDNKCTVHTTIEEARSAVPYGLYRIPRAPIDPLQIVESWI